MGPWRRFKAFVKRTVIRLFLKIARTRFVRFVRKVVRASAVPLAITGGGSVVGAGVASAVAFPLGYGALIGGAIAAAGIVVTKLYLKNATEARSRQRLKLNYTVWSRKENSSAGRSYVIESNASSLGRRF